MKRTVAQCLLGALAIGDVAEVDHHTSHDWIVREVCGSDAEPSVRSVGLDGLHLGVGRRRRWCSQRCAGLSGAVLVGRTEERDGVHASRRFTASTHHRGEVRRIVHDAPLLVHHDHGIGGVLGKCRVEPACCAPALLPDGCGPGKAGRAGERQEDERYRGAEQRQRVRLLVPLRIDQISINAGTSSGRNVMRMRPLVTRVSMKASCPHRRPTFPARPRREADGRPNHPADVQPSRTARNCPSAAM